MMRSIVLEASTVCKRGEDQMAGFRRFQRDFDRFLIAHFAHKDYLRAPGASAARRAKAKLGVSLCSSR